MSPSLLVALAMTLAAIAFVVVLLTGFPFVNIQSRKLRSALRGWDVRCSYYSNAFDTGPGRCPFCRGALYMLFSGKVVYSPTGIGTYQSERSGFACCRCLSAASDDIAKPCAWVALDDFLQRGFKTKALEVRPVKAGSY